MQSSIAANSSRSGRGRWLTTYVPLLVWIIVILGLGSGVGTSHQTSRFIRPLLEFLFPGASLETLAVYHGLIRKAAHVFEYAVLGILAVRAFRVYGWLGRNTLLFAIGLVVLVASLDEFNQSFNPQRTGTIYDVFIDLAGGLIGTFIAWFIFQRGQVMSAELPRSTPG